MQLPRHLHTLLLFTWTDYKTIFLPITAFACATAPLHSASRLLQAWSWIWLHQLMCNVSNQARSKEEDVLNRPWRPLPSGRVSEAAAVRLRHLTVLVCLLHSYMCGWDMVAVTAGLMLTTYFYDNVGLASHHLGKSLCNIGGYTAFEIGATKLVGDTRALDHISWIAVVISGTLIFTTVHTQDFPDVEGDAKLGRVTFPIYAPETARLFTICAMVIWSLFLCWFWKVDTGVSTAMFALGLFVGLRFYWWRTPEHDARSYLIYNIWLMLAHLLPVKGRMQGTNID